MDFWATPRRPEALALTLGANEGILIRVPGDSAWSTVALKFPFLTRRLHLVRQETSNFRDVMDPTEYCMISLLFGTQKSRAHRNSTKVRLGLEFQEMRCSSKCTNFHL